jgi:hypothetical protein
MKHYEFKAQRVHMRGMPMEELNQLGKRGFRVVASSIHNNDFVLLLEKEFGDAAPKRAPKKKEPKPKKEEQLELELDVIESASAEE